LDLPASKGVTPPNGTADAPKPQFLSQALPAPFKPTTPTRPTFAAPPVPIKPIVPPSSSESPATNGSTPSGADFRLEVRQEFVRRAPQIQIELRDRVSALIKSKSTTDQLNLLRDLEGCVSSLSSLSGITGFSRISHLSGALDALIKDLLKKPSQMTASVLRTVAHASDCMNLLFRDLSTIPQDVPESMLILAVDDEPISRRTISVALSKAALRCVGVEDSRVALTILTENPFDLIFLDAEMPGLNGFELCTELRKLPTNKATPVIFVTSLTKFEIRAQSSLAGGNDLIAKPFLMMELAVKALTYLLKPSARVESKAKPAP
jgi:CheY-like chemotaxis protein